ncbi:hypothetical protein K440DRAFT_663469 [Wilcoxina mikolae CBS 423.85]|nr:hypothetical protein K440DRAFT_663469 [Wilcoxina mikolae CBS 423.85]
MSSSSIHKQSFTILDRPTRSVVLYPASAAIVRDITDIVVKPGINEYTINNISGVAKESSFRVEGHGTDATITDMSVEFIRSPEQQLYDSDDSDSDSESESESEDVKILRGIEEDIYGLRCELESLEWDLQTANNSVLAWEAYGRNLCGIRSNAGEDKPEEPVNTECMTKFTELYALSRSNSGKMRNSVREKTREIETKEKEQKKLREMIDKRTKRQKHNDLVRQQRKSEEDRLAKHYPYYRLKVTVEAETLPSDAPSITADIDTGKPKHPNDGAPPSDAKGPSLRISYLVTHAGWTSYLVGWTPKFDLRFETVSRTGVLGFRAETRNATGETWSEAAVTLSTVETKYSSFLERIPQLNEWKIGLGKKEDSDKNMFSDQEWKYRLQTNIFGGFGSCGTGTGFGANSQSATTGGGLFGAQQQQQLPATGGLGAAAAAHSSPFAARNLFGGPPPQSGSLFGSLAPASSTGGGLFGNSSQQPSSTSAFGASAPTSGGLFGSSSQQPSSTSTFGAFAAAPSTGGGLFGNSSQQPSSTPAFGASAPASGGLFGSSSQQPSSTCAPAFGQSVFGQSVFGQSTLPFGAPRPEPEDRERHRRGRSRSRTPPSRVPSPAALPYKLDTKMSLSASTANTYGIITTFSLPGKKTLSNSATPLRFMVSETILSDIDLTYTCTPKFRTAAFLTASLSLPSSAPPLPERSIASVSVDGTFFGTLPIPKKLEDGEKMQIPLGVDEEIEVTYSPPKRRSEIKGILRKEETLTFSRTFTVKNRKGRQVVVVVRDQVPVVDEERPVTMTIKKPDEEKGEVEIKEGGMVEWRYTLEAGEVRKGELEWEIVVENGTGVETLS